MPLWDGADIFGFEVVGPHIESIPRQTQRTAFFGVDGVLQIDGGFRGRMARAGGKLEADNQGDLGLLKGIWRSYEDGNQYVLVDPDGVAWLATLDGFFPEGREEYNAATGLYQQRYHVMFFIFD